LVANGFWGGGWRKRRGDSGPLRSACFRAGGLQLAACGVGERAWEEHWVEVDGTSATSLGSPATPRGGAQQRADRANADGSGGTVWHRRCIDEECMGHDTQDPSALRAGSG